MAVTAGNGMSGRIKLAVALIAGLALAGFAAIDAWRSVSRELSPAAALAVYPEDPFLAVNYASAQYEQAEDKDAAAVGAREAALASLRDHALNPDALRALARIEPDKAKSEELLDLSLDLTRRNSPAQLLRALRAMQDGELAVGLKHIDLALRGRSATRELLFPQMITVIEDPRGRRELAPYFANPPSWFPQFLRYAIGEVEDPATLGSLIASAPRLPDNEEYRDIRHRTLERLVLADRVDVARDLFETLPGRDEKVLVSPAMTSALTAKTNGAMGWYFFEGSAVGGSIGGGGEDSPQIMNLYAFPGERGNVASKLLYLPAGPYTLSIRYRETVMPDESSLRWVVQCMGDENRRTLADTGLSRPAGGTAQDLSFTVPADCRAQRLLGVIAGAPNAMDDAEAIISAFDLRRGG